MLNFFQFLRDVSKNILKVQNILRSILSSSPSNKPTRGAGDGFYIIALKVHHMPIFLLLSPISPPNYICSFNKSFLSTCYILGTLLLDISFIPLCFLKVFFLYNMLFFYKKVKRLWNLFKSHPKTKGVS